MPSQIAQKAIDILSPSMGEVWARAKVESACIWIGTDIEILSEYELPGFIEVFEQSCRRSLGNHTAQNIKQQLLNNLKN